MYVSFWWALKKLCREVEKNLIPKKVEKNWPISNETSTCFGFPLTFQFSAHEPVSFSRQWSPIFEKTFLGKAQSCCCVSGRFLPIVISRDCFYITLPTLDSPELFTSRENHLLRSTWNPQIESILYNKSQKKLFFRKQAVVFCVFREKEISS